MRIRTPHNQTSRSGNSNRSVLKVYMANQLDLNEAEMEEYEEVVNELARQLDEVSKINDDLTANISLLHDEKDEFIKMKSNELEEQKLDFQTQIQGLQATITETNTVRTNSCKLILLEYQLEGPLYFETDIFFDFLKCSVILFLILNLSNFPNLCCLFISFSL